MIIVNLELGNQDELMKRWLSILEIITEDIRCKRVDQFMAEIDKIPYTWLNRTNKKL